MTAERSRPEAAEGSEAGARAEIVDAAAEVFMAFGFAATTLDAVAERLGATKGRIYYYFESKADLYFAVQMAAMDKLLEAIRPLAMQGGGPDPTLRRMALRHAEILLTDLPVQKVAVQGLERRLLLSVTARNAKPLRAIIAQRDAYEQMFAEVIDEGVRAGVFVDMPARLLTKPFFGVLNWATVWYQPRGLQKPQDVAALTTMLADYAMRGIRRETSP